ncbi:MAG: 2-dehydropantoate 2-reductase [Lasallia pustulata]|uniref:2-dehydropantoate 2-reductase n=1 Tax=Lasallia pustulata TaxID=136370 RepID=A0A5M8Q584_9LECA|nr:MAG: 2-dehydropantoate 2-reductase [Lasallia pustulata]
MQDIPPPITLLLHRANLIQDWSEAGRTIEIITAGVSSKGGVFDIEAVHAQPEDLSATKRRGPRDIIHNVIVATKATSTVAAISAIKDRLTHESTILFAQNGMGTAEDVSKIVFPDVATRPRYLACVTSHGVYSQGPFRSVHAGFGSVAIGNVIQDQQSNEDEDSLHKTGNSAYLVKEIVRAPILAAREVSSVVLTQLQLEKLVVNAMLNPLTAIFNLRNGELFTHSKIMRLMRLLLTEASKVIRSLPELQDDPATQKRFSATKLNAVVLDVAEKTAQNTSSMLQDVRAGRQTEIEYINGYIVRRGVQIGVDCSNNYKLVQFIKERCTISDEEIKQHFPDI